MGVYIKGMEMPKSCDECPMFNIDIDGGCYCTKYFVIRKKDQDRPDWCPLVPVPKHGRLIDADELLALVYANIALFDSTPGRLGADQKLVRAWLESMADDINDAPTIIPAEEGE